ncbi:AIPR family protein [Vibrio alginolyticus]
MSKYKTLVHILDQICQEAPEKFQRYRPDKDNIEKSNQARSRALIHLYLKVNFGLLDFSSRERLVTDGSYDGGIDAYYIDKETRTIYIIQSKFRTNERNFEEKPIDIDELASMEIARILEGETEDENGNNYNGKILQLQRDMQEVPDIGRYREKVILLANAPKCNTRALKLLCDGVSPIVFDFSRIYNDLVFPVVNGTYYNSSELTISLNLSNKSSSAARIDYEVQTELEKCDITVVFVPTVEIGRILHRYKNSILKFNPRCYLELSNNSVNKSILDTITSKNTNEFALFNNGITMLSDSTDFSQKIGKQGEAQICINNPQIINGGQTAHTLSKAYEEYVLEDSDPEVFLGKEVLLKIITFDGESHDEWDKLKLIEDISKATNQQSSVDDADRRSNDKVQVDLQQKIFDDFGLYYERKKGEFADGINAKYIHRSQIVARDVLMRLAVAISKEPSAARRSGTNVLFSERNFHKYFGTGVDHVSLIHALRVHQHLREIEAKAEGFVSKYNVENYGQALRYGKYAVVSVIHNKYYSKSSEGFRFDEIPTLVDEVLSHWKNFESSAMSRASNTSYFRSASYSSSNSKDINFEGYYKGKTINQDLEEFWYN